MTCPVCGSEMHYIMLGGDGYFACNSCTYSEPPSSYFSLPADDKEIMNCASCGAPINQLRFAVDDCWNAGEKYVECPSCGWHHVLDDAELKEKLDKYMGFHVEDAAFRLTRNGFGQFMLEYTKNHRERFERRGD